jgi:hypothetical protein
MCDSSRLTALYADDLRLQREQVMTRALRKPSIARRTTRNRVAAGLHRLADHLEGRSEPDVR